MKKACVMLISAVFVFMAIGIFTKDKVNNPKLIEWLPEYEDAQCYQGKGFQDYTQYCKYYYDEAVIQFIEKEQALMCVREADEARMIVDYFENFQKWIEHEEFYSKCYFDLANVNVGDYFFIEKHYNDEEFEYNPEKYPTYSVYWLDRETLTMRFIHNGV